MPLLKFLHLHVPLFGLHHLFGRSMDPAKLRAIFVSIANTGCPIGLDLQNFDYYYSQWCGNGERIPVDEE